MNLAGLARLERATLRLEDECSYSTELQALRMEAVERFELSTFPLREGCSCHLELHRH